MAVFGDIKEVRNIELKDGESVSVPSGEIWKVNATVALQDSFSEDSSPNGGYTLSMSDSYIASLTFLRYDGSDPADHAAMSSGQAEVFAEDTDSFTYNETQVGDISGNANLSVVVMDAV